MRRSIPGFDGLGLGHDPFDINAGVTTSHLKSALEARLAMRIAPAEKPRSPSKKPAQVAPDKDAGK